MQDLGYSTVPPSSDFTLCERCQSSLSALSPDDVLGLHLRSREPPDLPPLGGRGEGLGSLGGLSIELDRDLARLEPDTFNLLQVGLYTPD